MSEYRPSFLPVGIFFVVCCMMGISCLPIFVERIFQTVVNICELCTEVSKANFVFCWTLTLHEFWDTLYELLILGNVWNIAVSVQVYSCILREHSEILCACVCVRTCVGWGGFIIMKCSSSSMKNWHNFCASDRQSAIIHGSLLISCRCG